MADQPPENASGDPRLDAILARLKTKVAENEVRGPQKPKSSPRDALRARQATPRGVGG